jgi:Flp pilus assembly pilin Flp
MGARHLFKTMKIFAITLRREERGQDLIEYGLLVCLIAVVAIAGVTSVGSTLRDVFWATIAPALP